MVVPYIQGVQRNGVAACVKHFAVNDQETDRFNVEVKIDDRTLHEIHLPAFKAAVHDGGVWARNGFLFDLQRPTLLPQPIPAA